MAGEQGDRTVLVIPEEYHQQRADQALSGLVNISRSQIQKVIKLGQVLRNGSPLKARDLLSQGDEVEVLGLATSEPIGLNPVPMDLDIVFEDESLMVINKAPGVVVHPGAGTKDPTLIEGILHYLQTSAEQMPGEMDRPGIVHRLDKDTSGVMVVAKDEETHRGLAQQFKDKSNLREYVALLKGRMTEDETEVESYLFGTLAIAHALPA